MHEQEQPGNKTLAILGYLLFLGGWTGFCVTVVLMVSTKPQFVGQNWVSLWFGALAIVGLVLMIVNRKVLKIPTKGGRLLGQVLAQLGIILSAGFFLWLIDNTWGGWWLGTAFLVGSVALFTVGMLIALGKRDRDVSQ